VGLLSHPVRGVRALSGSSFYALRGEVADRDYLSIMCGLGAGASRGLLSLATIDPAAAPRIDFRYMSEPGDLRAMRSAVRTTAEIVNRSEFRQLEPRYSTAPSAAELKSDRDLDAWIMHHLGTSYHSAGTCKMGLAEDEEAVVDQHCRVRGVDRLRVVDLSVLPTITRRPPNATAIMLGERVAELINAEI
jgi:choline dehydrogenase